MFWDKWFEPKPFNSGFLPEKDGHRVFFAEFGNPSGIPVVVFHGGPGGCFKNGRAKYANLRKYRVIMFDQRGCGRSEPLGKLEYNATQDLLDDTTRLLNYLKINTKVILWGGSWGSTLALLWAEQNCDRVEKLLLSQIFLANDDFRNWEFDGNKYIYPEFVACLKEESSENIYIYYNDLIKSSNVLNQLKAINQYGWYERICGSYKPEFSCFTEVSEEELASQRIYMHYAANSFFLGGNDILDNADKIKNIDILLIHSRLDLVCPFKGAFDLHNKLSKSQLIVVPAFGHVNKLIRKTIAQEIRKILN